ncbi:hypothetical protein EDB85DRAFT_1887161 [Lactarius pseudohatsudake]|nr:hypothetical protein EDB85DRAFT_1887161 [Lactarius pseudohatsudake]
MRSLARPLLSDTQTRTRMAPPPPLRPHLCLCGNGKGPFDPPPLFFAQRRHGRRNGGPPFTPSSRLGEPPPLSLLRATLRPFTRKGGAGKDTNRDHAGPDPPPLRPCLSLRANGELHGKGHTLPPLVCARAHDACRPPDPSLLRPRQHRPIGTERERVRARRPGPPPSAAAPSTRGKGAREGTRRPAQSPSLFGRGALYARKGSTQGHMTPCPVPPPPSAAAPCTRRKGAREGMRPPVPPFPICAEGGRTRARGPFLLGRAILYARRGAHEGTLPGNPLAASRYAWKRLTPMPVYAQRGCRKGGTSAPHAGERTGGAHPFVPTFVQNRGPGWCTNRAGGLHATGRSVMFLPGRSTRLESRVPVCCCNRVAGCRGVRWSSIMADRGQVDSGGTGSERALKMMKVEGRVSEVTPASKRVINVVIRRVDSAVLLARLQRGSHLSLDPYRIASEARPARAQAHPGSSGRVEAGHMPGSRDGRTSGPIPKAPGSGSETGREINRSPGVPFSRYPLGLLLLPILSPVRVGLLRLANPTKGLQACWRTP